jgi:hypothetical protein
LFVKIHILKQLFGKQNQHSMAAGNKGENTLAIPPTSVLHEACVAQQQHISPSPHTNNAQDLPYIRANDPSAGSPTETLLRLLLPLSDKVH